MSVEGLGRALVGAVCALLLCTAAAEAQQVCYAYDSAGRLTGVIDENRNAAFYEYDAVGNILSISRETPTGPVTIYRVYPLNGKPGEQVEVFGVGFNSTPGNNQVTVGGVTAAVSSTLPCTLVVDVPPDGITGPMHVTTPSGEDTSDQSVLVERFAISGTANSVLPNILVQYTVTSNGCNDPAVVWKVNGVGGGTATSGTISTSGLFTAPAAIPTPAYAIIRAQSVVCPTLFDEKTLNIVTSATTFVYATASVMHGAQPVLLPNGTVFGRASARHGAPDVALPANTVISSVSVDNGAPFITALSPNVRTRSVNSFQILVTGLNLAGATGLTIFNASAPDPVITVSNVTVNANGTISATMLVPTTAALGVRTVRVDRPGGNSTAVQTSTNMFTVQ